MIRLPSTPPVHWWTVIVQLERHGYTHGAIAASIGSSRTTMQGWKNANSSPRHEDGERLIGLWCEVTGKAREDLPRQQGVISAAKISQPAVRYGPARSAA